VGLVRTSGKLGSRMLADMFLGSADAAARQMFDEIQRDSAEPEMAARLLELTYALDARAFVARVKAPVLVLHRKDDRAIAHKQSVALAAALPDASLCTLAGRAHMPWHEDGDAVVDAICTFLDGRPLVLDAPSQPPAVERHTQPLPGGAVGLQSSLERWQRYRIEQFLGAGGMGEVYRAWDPRLERAVAIKLLRSGGGQTEERFVREARAQARLSHPHICPVYEVGELDGRPYIAMQLIDGPTLTRAAEKLSLEERVRVVKQVAEALHEAHRAGLVHRDVKPDNVLVERGESGLRPFVTDFGLVRDLSAPAQTGSVIVGTPGFMSPEQARGDRVIDARSDLFSLGATLFALLTGAPPFSSPSPLELLRQVVHDEPRLPATVPAGLCAVVRKCLEKAPDQRYQSARSLADDLQRFLDGAPTPRARARSSRR
jgi:hypothetical protein